MTESNVVRRTGRCPTCRIGVQVLYRYLDSEGWYCRCDVCDSREPTQTYPPLTLVPPTKEVTRP